MKNYLPFFNRPLKSQLWRGLALLTFFSLTTIYPVVAQYKIWDKTYGGNGEDYFTSLQPTPDGGYITGGYSNSKLSGDKTHVNKGPSYTTDYWIVKLKADGSKAWDKTLGGTQDDKLVTIQPTLDGGYIIGGYSRSGIGADKTEANRGTTFTHDYWVIKLNAAGNKVWDKTFGGVQDDRLTSLLQTQDGGYLVGGTSLTGKSREKTAPSQGMEDFWVLKLKADGSIQWDKTIGGKNNDKLASLLQTKDGGYLLGGTSDSGISGDKTEKTRDKGSSISEIGDYWLVKLNAAGSKVWDKTLGGTNQDQLSSLIQTKDGGYLLGGSSSSGIGGEKTQASRDTAGYDGFYPYKDFWVVKVDDQGKKVWDKTIGGDKYDGISSVQQTRDGGYLLGGSSNSNVSGEKTFKCIGFFTDYWLVKLNANGSKDWDKVIGGSDEDNLAVALQTSDNNYILAGSSSSALGGDKSEERKGGPDYWVVKLDNNVDYKKEQTISFGPILYKDYLTQKRFTLAATSSSGLPVSYKITSGPATVKDNQLTLTGTGTVIVEANQTGNTAYNAAWPVRQSFEAFDSPVTQVWNKTYGGVITTEIPNGNGGECDTRFGSSSLTAMVATPDGGYLLGGTSDSKKGNDKSEDHLGTVSENSCYSSEQTITDFWLVKTDTNGNKLWDKTFGTPDREQLVALVTTPDGGYLLGGTTSSAYIGSQSYSDYYLVKLDANGNKLWDQKLSTKQYDNMTNLIATPDGGYLISGNDYSVLKVDAQGKLLWQKDFDGLEYSSFESLLATSDGGYLLGGAFDSGQTGSNGRTGVNFWVVKLDANGNKLWSKTYGGNSSEGISNLIATPDGHYLLGGYSNSGISGDKSEANNGGADYWLVKIDSKGNRIWDKTLGGSATDGLQSLISTPDGGYLLGGTSTSSISGDKSEIQRGDDADFWIVKTDANGQKIWDKTLGTLFSEFTFTLDLLADPNGSYVLGGSSRSGIGGDKEDALKGLQDFWVIKIKDKNVSENTAWNMRYGGSGTDNLTSVIKTADGGYLAGGYSNSGNSGDKTQASQGKNDYWIVKSDQNGKKLWDKRYGGSDHDYLNRVIQTSDGGYLVAGSSLSGKSGDKSQASQGERDYWVVKVDATGNKQWDKTFGGSGYEELIKVIQLSTGEYVLGGTSRSPVSGDVSQASPGTKDYWLVKISSTGTKIWDKRYGGQGDDILGSFTETREGGFLLAGNSRSGARGDKSQSSRGGADFWVVNTDKDGTILWEKTFGGKYEEVAYSVARSSSGYYISGTSDSDKSGDKSQARQGRNDYWVVKTDLNGNKIWDRTFGGNADDELRASTGLADGGLVLGGYSYSEVSGSKTHGSQGASDYWLVRVDREGNQVYDKRLGGSGQDELHAIFSTPDGGLLLGGRSGSNVSGDKAQPSQGSNDYWLVKLAPESSSIRVAARVASELEPTVTLFNSFNAYPNPFHDKVSVSFTLPESQPVTLKVYDSQGREITTLFRGEAKAKQPTQVEWQAGKQASGLYLLQLQTPTKKQQQKIILAP